ncbi:MAG TPA: MmgE/PrpD family protein, partial [Acidimicrobiales bacterium]|nr:MmgE/PrpD family protein [Acidimicrobiales bacterium]
VLDFDDLHMESTSHVSAVCGAASLACGGGARAYLAGAGVMARLGTALGWTHYASGWHATCTAGAPGAAAAAAAALGLDEEATARAIVLALPAAGGVQRAFGTDAKSLQVGFAAEAGVRAAKLARAGASADLAALEQWLALVGGARSRVDLGGPAVPGGLAVKLFPCCYAMQRPIFAMRDLVANGVEPAEVERVTLRTPASAIQPLIHHRPTTALEGKFSLEYAVAAVVLDGYPGFASFTDAAVRRDEAGMLMRRVEVDAVPGGDSILAGDVEIECALAGGRTASARLEVPPGAPGRPPGAAELTAKLADCGDDVPALLAGITWEAAPELLREQLGPLATTRTRHRAGEVA